MSSIQAATAGATEAVDAAAQSRALYLDLLKKSLTHTLYSPTDVTPFLPRNFATRLLVRKLREHGIVPLRKVDDTAERREVGRDWPVFAQTMIGLKRVEQLQRAVEEVIARNVPGDLIETGVWRGGASIFMRGVLKAHGVTDRTVYVADSFQGLPPPDPKYPADAGATWHEYEELAISLEEVRENFRRYDLYDAQVQLVKGWFKDTLPGLKDKRWAVARLDGDMYGSTLDALTHLYPNLSPGGFLIIDDYEIPSCRKAVEDYRAAHGITEEIHLIDWTGAYWQRRA